MEHTVKLKWNHISQNEKLFIKENAMKLLNLGVGPAEDQSISHIKDALSRIIVEMIKREWPQQWTTLLSELSDACSQGESQTELVLLVFLRLVEDVALLQTIESNQRRKDIYQALTVNMSEIFDFFLRLIELHVNGFRNTTVMGDQSKALAHSRVVQVVLQTLTGFVEWVSIVHIMGSDGKLLQILCILLNDDAFQIPAAECLLQIVNRKGQFKDKKPLLLLFGEDAMGYIYRAANLFQDKISEKYYMFLKKLVQVLFGLATQLTSVWGKEDCISKCPSYFTTFMETVLCFTRHASLTLSHNASLIWIALLKNDQISKDPLIIEYIPKIVEVVGPKIYKITYPTGSRPIEITMNPQVFASIDYDSDEEFIIFFQRCRCDFLEIFRQSTLIAPLVTFGYCEQWLNVRLQKSQTEVGTAATVFDPVYLEWEALVACLDSVLSRMLLVTERPSVPSGLRLLEACLKVESHDPLILSIVLSCISALFVFLSMSSCQISITSQNCVTMNNVNLLPKVLEKIFQGLVYSEPNNRIVNFSEVVKSLRRHSASLMVKLAHKYPLLLLPLFDQINTTIQDLIRRSDQLSRMEQITLQEAMILISNHFCDYERQTNFIGEILHTGQSQWMEISPGLKSASDFISFIGLDKTPIHPKEGNIYIQNRSKIVHALNQVLGVMKRCSWPDDPDRASRGGFVVGLTESGNPIFRNPATSHIVPLLQQILSLLKVLNDVFNPECIQLLSPGYRNAFQIVENEKKNLMGVYVVFPDPMDATQKIAGTALERMQKFLTLTYENCYHLMGSAGPSLGRDLYQLPGIADAFIGNIFGTLENVPDYRLRVVIRVFLKPFVYSCPPAFYETVLLPIFAQLAPQMLTRLSQRWQYISGLYESGQLGDGDDNTEEVLADIIIRALTREYLGVLKVALVGGTLTADHGSNELMTESPDDHSMDGQQPPTRAHVAAMAAEIISDLGSKLLRCPATCTPIIMTVLSVLSFNDSNSSLRATYLVGPIIKFLAVENLLTPSLSSTVLIAILQGLQIHGQHESNEVSAILFFKFFFVVINFYFVFFLGCFKYIGCTSL